MYTLIANMFYFYYSGDICKERKLHSPGSPGLPGDPNSSTGNKMLKHIVSTQVKVLI